MTHKTISVTMAILSIFIAIPLMAPADDNEPDEGERLILLGKNLEIVAGAPSGGPTGTDFPGVPVDFPSINVEEFKTFSILGTEGVCAQPFLPNVFVRVST